MSQQNQQSQQPTVTGAGAQSTSVPSQSVDFASPRPAGKISRFQELSIRLLNNKFRGLSPSGGCASLSFDQGVPKKTPNYSAI